MKRNIYWRNKDKYKRQKVREPYYLNRFRNQSFYHNSYWLDARLYVLASFPFCQKCDKEVATEVHHTININTDEGWEQRLNLDLLESRCRSCHQQDTRQEMDDRQKELQRLRIEETMVDLNNFN